VASTRAADSAAALRLVIQDAGPRGGVDLLHGLPMSLTAPTGKPVARQVVQAFGGMSAGSHLWSV
jgi:hypothetical protein